jgi:hypothetical protein
LFIEAPSEAERDYDRRMNWERLPYEWPPGVQVLFVPEWPRGTRSVGGRDEPVEADLYPIESVDLRKLLAENGVQTGFATEIGENGPFLIRESVADFWLGVVVLLRDFVMSGGASYLAAAIRERTAGMGIRRVRGRIGVGRVQDGETLVAFAEFDGLTGPEFSETFVEAVAALAASKDE